VPRPIDPDVPFDEPVEDPALPSGPDVPFEEPPDVPDGPVPPDVPSPDPRMFAESGPAPAGGDPMSEAAGVAPDASESQEIEVFYTFARSPRRRSERPHRPAGGSANGKGKPRHQSVTKGAEGPNHGPHAGRGDRPRRGSDEIRKGKGDRREDKPPKTGSAPRPERPIDPDNPFAALMALKLRS
jgi:ATP-dependent RNA helicase SUPV3L1/SUV3